MNINGHDIGVCSWSLKPQDTQDLITKVRELGLNHVQLVLGSLVQADDKRKHQELGLIRNSGLVLTAGMIGFPGEDYTSIAIIRKTGGFLPDEEWPVRRKMTEQAAAIGVELGLTKISTHVGFVPPSSDEKYRTVVDRIREVANLFNDRGLTLLMETGQERAHELLQSLNDLACKNVKVNFDPANMILYGAGDPCEAVTTLGRHIGHVHIKDATLSKQPGVLWGEEVAFGTGQVPVKRFLSALNEVGYTGPLTIEREAGSDRMGDVRKAIETLRQAYGV